MSIIVRYCITENECEINERKLKVLIAIGQWVGDNVLNNFLQMHSLLAKHNIKQTFSMWLSRIEIHHCK